LRSQFCSIFIIKVCPVSVLSKSLTVTERRELLLSHVLDLLSSGKILWSIDIDEDRQISQHKEAIIHKLAFYSDRNNGASTV
jgi:hypothetical protein